MSAQRKSGGFTSVLIPNDPKSPPGDYGAKNGCGNSSVNDGYTNGCWYCIQSDSTSRGSQQ